MTDPHPLDSPIIPMGSGVSVGLQAAKTISSVLVDGALETTLEGLRPHTRYVLVLQAYNSRGPGPSSPTVTAITAEDSEWRLALLEKIIYPDTFFKYLLQTKYFG